MAETRETRLGPLGAPTLILNPSTDAGFVDRARDLVGEGTTAEALQAALRGYYPRAVVRRRDLSAERESWYVYRDGHWVPPEGWRAGE